MASPEQTRSGSQPAPARRPGTANPRKALTIGAVCKILGQEFEDISISKIRYLEDQRLLAPKRTKGGYRLYSQADVERLRAILRMQRDEFLPLRVIRQELSAGAIADRSSAGSTARRAVSLEAAPALISIDEMVEQTGTEPAFLLELEEYGLIVPDRSGGEIHYEEADLEIVKAAHEMARYGVAARNLRVFKSSAERESSLLEQLFAPALRSASTARRKEALENLERMAGTCSQLNHLLLIRDLRRLRS